MLLRSESSTTFELITLESGGQRHEQIIRWLNVDCVKTGWLVKSNDRWTITDERREACSQLQAPEACYKRAVHL